ncbi:condensation domain-containing protein [Silvibacterium acidisoli]|uniref:condensation domain-containing protein n=1 Tax=Acidobacteriaceae bacterium ZG23-2 TaxID=2883246 RepID=UPI00406C8DAE
MTQSQPAMLRSLTAHEEIYWLLNWNSPIHAVLAAHVVGSTTAEDWRVALDLLQQRHPLLSVSIDAADGYRPFFKHHAQAPIPLRVVAGESVSRWEAEIERELAIPFAPGEAPLLRAVLIHQPDRSVIILAACHSIADGTSIQLLVRDLLMAMAGHSLEPLGFPRSEEELLDISPQPPTQVIIEDLSDAPINDAGQPSVLSLQLTQELTQKLTTRARMEGTTVHGVLAAAFVLAMRQQAPEFLTKPVRIISPVNTRPVLGAQQECGLYFTSPQASFDPETAHSFWEIARSARQRIIEASTREVLTGVTNYMQCMIAGGLTKASAADTLNNAFATDLLLSNLGRTPFDSMFGHLKLESLWGPAVLSGIHAAQTVGAASTNGSLCLLLTSYEPIPFLLQTVETILSNI